MTAKSRNTKAEGGRRKAEGMLHTPHSPFRTPRPAMTLIELLVVIVILTTIVAAAIPIMSPANDDRRLREATRGFNTFITGAQTRAIALKRPFGIALKRLSQDTDNDNNPNNAHDDNGVCLEVFYVEQPSPFTGFDVSSAAMVALDNGPTGGVGQVLIRFVAPGNAVQQNSDRLPIGWDPDVLPPSLVRPGDVVELSGNQFRLTDTDFDTDTGFYTPTSGNPDGTLVAVPVNDTGQLILPEYDKNGLSLREAAPLFEEPYYTPPARYQILRQAAATSDEPYQLPEGTAIDLRASGVGRDDYFYVPGQNDNSQGVLILFTPEGRVARVSYSQAPVAPNEAPTFDQPVVDNIFLLVGKRENIPAPLAGTDPTLDPSTFSASPPKTEEQLSEIREPINWLSGSSRWIVIGSQSGRVVTVENAFVDLPELATPSPSELSRNQQILAAREFTREMSQLGGR